MSLVYACFFELRTSCGISYIGLSWDSISMSFTLIALIVPLTTPVLVDINASAFWWNSERWNNWLYQSQYLPVSQNCTRIDVGFNSVPFWAATEGICPSSKTSLLCCSTPLSFNYAFSSSVFFFSFHFSTHPTIHLMSLPAYPVQIITGACPSTQRRNLRENINIHEAQTLIPVSSDLMCDWDEYLCAGYVMCQWKVSFWSRGLTASRGWKDAFSISSSCLWENQMEQSRVCRVVRSCQQAAVDTPCVCVPAHTHVSRNLHSTC